MQWIRGTLPPYICTLHLTAAGTTTIVARNNYKQTDNATMSSISEKQELEATGRAGLAHRTFVTNTNQSHLPKP